LLQSGVGQAGQILRVGKVFVPGLGSVEHVVGKLGRELTEAFFDLAIAFFGLALQGHTPKSEIPQGVVDGLALGLAQLEPEKRFLQQRLDELDAAQRKA